MKYIDLKDKSEKELNEMLKEKKLLLFKLRAKLKTMQLNNPNEIKETRRDIARINTALSALKNEVKA
jgi:large subunit ribosomal protein L29